MSKMKTTIVTVLFPMLSIAVFAAFAPTAFGQASNGLPETRPDSGPDIKGSIVRPRVFFVSPKDGATVKSPFVVKFGLEGMKVHKADEVIPGTGHHHLIINAGSVAKGQPIPKDEHHLHFGDGATQTKVKLPPGEYTLTLQFGDGSHLSYGQEMSSTISIKVK
jgi:hypothetical protein